MATRGRILWYILSQVTSSIYRNVRLTVTTRLVDSHNALKKAIARRGVTFALQPTLSWSRTLLQSTSAHLPTGSIKATRSVTTLQTFEIRAPRKMWPSVVSIPHRSLYFCARLSSDTCSESEIVRGHDWHNSCNGLHSVFVILVTYTRVRTHHDENVNEDMLIRI